MLFPLQGKMGMLSRWQNSSSSRTSIGSPGLFPSPGSGASLVIPWRWSSPSSAAEKNGVRRLRASVSDLLRQAAPACPGSLLWRQACLPRLSPAQGPVLAVRGVKSERLDWLADNPLYTKRFAFFVGRRCRETPVKEVAEELFLDWHTVKELDKQYMRAQLRRAGTPAPRVIGVDEIAIAKGHRYRIVVSDLERGRPIWFGGNDRSEASMDEFFAWLGPAKCGKIRLAVMDMWVAFRNSTLKEGNAPQAVIVYDKFHILKRLGEAMDKVRRREYAHLSGRDRRFIKGQRYTLLSHWGNLTAEGRASLKLLFKANKRLNKAYLL